MAKKLYVNVYEVGRCFGGREEGGWYYDCGEPTESRRVKHHKQAVRLQRQLQKECPRDRPGRYYCRVEIEPHPGRTFPSRRPYYE